MKVAFVIPFFGAQASGGAEALCRDTATHLARSGISVEIMTTRALDLAHGWDRDHYPAGTTQEDGLTVHRFPADRFDHDRFNRLNSRILAGEAISLDDENDFLAMHCSSVPLFEHLADAGTDYDWLCFIPYLFGTTVHGSRLWPEKTVLIPCLHDEGYARLRAMPPLFQRARRIVFNARAEQRLCNDLYRDLDARQVLLGAGVEADLAADGARFRQKYGIEGPFVLYAGRKAAGKNVHTLISYFSRYKQRTHKALRLILIGPAEIPIPPKAREHILDLGFVPRADKNDAYSAATVLCQPSVNESFSIVMMESWLSGTPCLVNGRCAVTREHTVGSGGGLIFENYADFEGCLDYLLEHEDMRDRMARAGRAYVLENCTWQSIVARYREEVFGA
jgi:glycosyltransferase involved in cell wall biosynthesis